MAMKKEGSTAAAAAPAVEAKVETTATADSGTAAAVSRLNKKKPETAKSEVTDPSMPPTRTKYDREQEETARGKTRCQTYCAALMSPALAGMNWETPEKLMDLIRKFADDGLAYSFNDPK